MPNFELTDATPGGWQLYGGRVEVDAPAVVVVTPAPDDRDPLDFRVTMVLDIVQGRLACTSLTADQLQKGSPGITGENLRRIPVAQYVAFAAQHLDVLRERHGERWRKFEAPSAGFTSQGMTDEALEDFARLYAAIQAGGGKPSGVLLSWYDMPRPTFSRWLAAARRRGTLVEEHQRGQR